MRIASRPDPVRPFRHLARAQVELARRSLAIYAELNGVDRAMALAAQAFTALFPLLIVVAATFEGGKGESLGDVLIDRFNLSGAVADSVRRALPTAGTVEDSVTALSVVILVVSALSFTRALQRLYERAWRLEARGVRDAAYGLGWLAGISLYTVPHAALAGHVVGWLGLAASITGGFVVWLVTPYVILARRVAWRRLVPQAMLAALGMTLLRAASALYMPRSISSAARQFGTIGLAFSLVSWLFFAAMVLTVSAAVGVAIAGRDERAGAGPGSGA